MCQSANDEKDVPHGLPPLASRGLLSGALTHKASLAEVLLVSVSASKIQHQAEVQLQWPRAHYFYRTDSAQADTVLLAESMRQITVAVAHSLYGVDSGQKFVLSALHLSNMSEMSGFLTETPTAVVGMVRVDASSQGANGPTTLEIHTTFSTGGASFASAFMASRIVPPATYKRLRQRIPVSEATLPYRPLEPRLLPRPTSRPSRRDRAVYRSGGSGWVLTPDPTHPLLFDHPLDHVPGMFVVEALRQAISEEYPGDAQEPRGVTVRYLKMIEIAEPCVLSFRVSDDESEAGQCVAFVLRQAGAVAAEGSFVRNVKPAVKATSVAGRG